MDRIESVYAPILNKSRDDDGILWVEGKITGPDLDGDLQRMDADWLKTAVPDWAKIGNVREAHNSARPVGKAVEVWDTSDGSWHMRAKIVDTEAARKVEHGIYNGFSIGVKNATIVKTQDAPNGLISSGRIVETSLADRPCLPTCLLTIAKADEAGDLQVLDTPVETIDEAAKADGPPAAAIKDEAGLKAAIKAASTPQEKAAATAAAKKLGLSDLIPDSWGSSSSGGSDGDKKPPFGKKADLPDITKADSPEVSAARQALAPLVQALSKEIDDLAAGDLGEQFDISRLTDAISSISQFLAHEVSEQPDNDSPSVPLYLSDQPDAAKADQSTPAEEASDMTEEQTRALFKTMLAEAVADLQKAATPDVTKTEQRSESNGLSKSEGAPAELVQGPDIGALITEAVTKAVEPLQSGLAEVTSKIDGMPAPGGPVVTRTTQQVQKSDQAELKAEYLRKSQDSTLTQNLRDGYAAMAAQLPG